MAHRRLGIALLAAAAGIGAARAQEPASGHRHGAEHRAADILFLQGSGTSVNPSDWRMPMLMRDHGAWRTMWMAQAFAVATDQSGPRGGDEVFSTNWGMLAAVRRADAVESAGGSIVNAYYAPIGDPALGPVAFPHRASAMELPQATLGHHWQDSTHIAANVFTFGWTKGPVRLEASGMHGHEPDENRWDVDFGPIDSWSARAVFLPSGRFVGQVSAGHLVRPEAAHDDDIVRATASLHHVGAPRHGRQPASSFIWASNRKSLARRTTHALTVETIVPLGGRDALAMRLGWSERDELFEFDHDLADQVAALTGREDFPVTALTLGWTREIVRGRRVEIGVGANVVEHRIAADLRPYYGEAPWGASLLLRARLAERAGGAHH